MQQKQKEDSPNGVLIVDKPAGMTSHDVVSKLRKVLKTKKIGHTGTLDPFATGVLVMLIGKATRLAKFLDKDTKSYEAIVRFGYSTDTGDRDGQPIGVSGIEDAGDLVDPRMLAFVSGIKNIPSKEVLLRKLGEVLPDFKGEIKQVPPMFSAKKRDGKKLYELAREGKTVEREPLDVRIDEIGVSDSEECASNEIVLSVTASAGTYIRTLAEDLGDAIDSPCHLAELRRVSAGQFSLEDAVGLDGLSRDSAIEKMGPMVRAISHLPTLELSVDDVDKIKHGMKVSASKDFEGVQNIALIDPNGDLLAIGEPSGSNEIQPRTVFV